MNVCIFCSFIPTHTHVGILFSIFLLTLAGLEKNGVVFFSFVLCFRRVIFCILIFSFAG